MEWEVIESRLRYLLENGRRTELRGALLMLNVVDIAQFMQTLDSEKMLMLFRLQPKDVSAEVFAYMDPEQQTESSSSRQRKESKVRLRFHTVVK